jgi:hypothetical protein
MFLKFDSIHFYLENKNALNSSEKIAIENNSVP